MKSIITNREQEVLDLIADEYSTGDIAKELYVSTNTIATHRMNILAKLDVKNTAGMIRKSFELGLLRVQGLSQAS